MNERASNPESSVLLEPEAHPGDAVDVRHLCFERGPRGLRMFLGDERCYLRVRLRLADPLRWPDRYVAVIDARDREICLLPSLEGLEPSSRQLVEAELAAFYRVPTVVRVRDLSFSSGPLYWHVDTDQGPREFVVKWNADTVQHLPDGRVRLTDVDGNCFVVPPAARLDPHSRRLVGLLR